MILNGVSTTATSSYPYFSIGPIDFSKLNFVRTEQIDYYYGYPDASATQEVLLSKVSQVYDPGLSFLYLSAITIGFFMCLAYGISKVRKMGK